MSCFLRFLGLYIVLFPISAFADGSKVFQDTTMKVVFSVPTSWMAKRCVAPRQCVEFFDPQYKDIQEPIALVNLLDVGLERASIDSHFTNKDGKWRMVLSGEDAKTVHTSNVTAIYGTVPCGFTDKRGFHASGAECLEVLLTNGIRTAHVQTGFFAAHQETLRYVVQNFRFLP